MRRVYQLLVCSSLMAMASFATADSNEVPASFSVVSWNISDDAFAREPEIFEDVLAWANADLVLLDETEVTLTAKRLNELLPGPANWNVHVGASGGRQRQVIASRSPVIPMPEFAEQIDYDDAVRAELSAAMTDHERSNPSWTMDSGIPVSGAIVEHGERRLLVVVTDLQCCGASPQSWQEQRRRIEARDIRRRIHSILRRESVDGLILAGDFNLVTGAFTLSILGGPYALPLGGVVPAEAYHADGVSTWTWDGRNTPFPNGTLDFQLYSPTALRPGKARILDSKSLAKTGRHRPIVVDYTWRPAAND